MKKLLFLLFFIPLVSFGQKVEEVNKSPETDSYTLTNKGKSTIYDYTSYAIITTSCSHISGYPDTMGAQIIIYSKDDESFQFVGDCNDEFSFRGIVQDFVILGDAGMSIGDGGFDVFDLKNQKYVFSGSYYGDKFKIVNSKIEFYEVIDHPSYSISYGKFTKPKCSEELEKYPESIGYIEKLIYDIATQQLERTGIYECAYFQ